MQLKFSREIETLKAEIENYKSQLQEKTIQIKTIGKLTSQKDAQNSREVDILKQELANLQVLNFCKIICKMLLK